MAGPAVAVRGIACMMTWFADPLTRLALLLHARLLIAPPAVITAFSMTTAVIVEPPATVAVPGSVQADEPPV